MEYQTLIDVHEAETAAERTKDREHAAELSQRAADAAPDAWDLYQRVRMGVE